MTDYLPNDLATMLDEVRLTVPDPGWIWIRPSLSYTTQVVREKALLLGGPHSPFFEHTDALLACQYVAGATQLVNARLLALESIPETSTLRDWLPLLESMAGAKEGLFVVTEHVESKDILLSLIINHLRNTLQSTIVKNRKVGGLELRPVLAEEQYQKEFSGTNEAMISVRREELPLIKKAWIRTIASVAFPSQAEQWGDLLVDVTIIEVGGESYSDLLDRFNLMTQAIKEIDRGDR